VHFRTGTSFVTGYFISLRASRIKHPPAQSSWQSLLQVPPGPPHSLAFSQLWHFLQMGVAPGMQMASHAQTYLYSVTFFVVQ
jgi:hypothetical protein